jgi:uncharacterized membrane protein
MRYKRLYTAILAGLIFIFYASLGNGIWNRPLDYTDWQYRAFHGVCHQMQERSFHINEVPMAVNSRCFGIFAGLLAAWLLVPYLMTVTANRKWPGLILAVAVIIQIIDFIAGQFSVWNSTNYTRFFLGIFLGIALVSMIADQFSKTINQ